MARRGLTLLAALGLAATLPPGPGGEPMRGGEAFAAREAMSRIFESMTRVFALSLEEGKLEDPAMRRRVQADLESLLRETERLESHGGGLNPSLAFLRRSLRDEVRDAERLFRRTDYEGARLALRQLTESCLACHSKLPSDSGFDLGRRFLQDERIARLPLEERVRLEVLSRQFDTARQTYEVILSSPAIEPAEIYFMGAFEGYLKITLRVRSEPGRAAATLERFRRRPDIPRYLAAYVEQWLEALRQPPVQPEAGDELARARELIETGRSSQLYPGDRRGLVHYVLASGLLHRYLDSAREPSKLSEAYYLLGLAEAGISTLSWLSEIEFFLESAIRADPRSPHALLAYLVLEEYTLAAYTGSAGIDVPSELRDHLERLRRLLSDP